MALPTRKTIVEGMGGPRAKVDAMAAQASTKIIAAEVAKAEAEAATTIVHTVKETIEGGEGAADATEVAMRVAAVTFETM